MVLSMGSNDMEASTPYSTKFFLALRGTLEFRSICCCQEIVWELRLDFLYVACVETCYVEIHM